MKTQRPEFIWGNSGSNTAANDEHVWCRFAGPGRGDCIHFVGLPGKSMPGKHNGPDDTVDIYGIPNGWCEYCWLEYKHALAKARIKELMQLLEDHRQQYANKCLELIELRKVLSGMPNDQAEARGTYELS